MCTDPEYQHPHYNHGRLNVMWSINGETFRALHWQNEPDIFSFTGSKTSQISIQMLWIPKRNHSRVSIQKWRTIADLWWCGWPTRKLYFKLISMLQDCGSHLLVRFPILCAHSLPAENALWMDQEWTVYMLLKRHCLTQNWTDFWLW